MVVEIHQHANAVWLAGGMYGVVVDCANAEVVDDVTMHSDLALGDDVTGLGYVVCPLPTWGSAAVTDYRVCHSYTPILWYKSRM